VANVFALHSVCRSIATSLQTSYPLSHEGVALPPCSFEVLSSRQMAAPFDDTNRVGLYLYRASTNEQARQQRASRPTFPRAEPLSLDLHLLFAAWGASALDEQVMLAWTLRHLHQHPLLDAGSLTPEAGWEADEVVQIVPADLSLEDTLRIWEGLASPYRLSAAYVARTVRLDPDELPDARAVVATRFAYSGSGALS
jgi:hypothetical protein